MYANFTKNARIQRFCLTNLFLILYLHTLLMELQILVGIDHYSKIKLS